MNELESAAEAEATEARFRAVRELPLDLPDSTTALLSHLSDPSWRVRRAAIERLLELRPPEALVEPLAERLGRGEDVQARNAAAEVLGRLGSIALAALAARLKHADADVRKFAADILGELGLPEATEALAGALADPDRNVRASAGEALGKLRTPRAAAALGRALRSEDHLLRVCALDGLYRMGAVPALDELEGLLRDRFLRKPLYRLLGRASDERALAMLLQGLLDPGKSAREAALAAIAEQAERGSGLFLGRLRLGVRPFQAGRAALESAAQECLGRGEPQVVQGALLVLGALGADGLAEAMAEAGVRPEVREVARASLALLGPGATASLTEALGRLSPAALALAGEMLGPAHAPMLTGLALERLPVATPEAAEPLVTLLGHVGDVQALEPLWVYADDMLGEDLQRNEGALLALLSLARRHPGPVRAAARRRWKAEPSAVGAALLAEVGEAEDMAALRQGLLSDEPRVRVACAQTLARRGVQASVDALRQNLSHHSPAVRAACLRALGVLRDPGLDVRVEASLFDAAPTVMAAAAEVVGWAGLQALGPLLVPLLDGKDGAVARAALVSLDELDRVTLPLLEKASEHPSAEVCREALRLAVGMAGGLELVRKRLSHSRWEVRRSAARVLGSVAGGSEKGLLRTQLANEQDPLVGEALFQALSELEARAR